MNRISIAIRPVSFEKSSEGNITGCISWKVDDKYFPEFEWSDFVVIVLTWWLEGAKRIYTGTSSMEEFRFMDGPFYVRIVRANAENYLVECWSDRLGQGPELSGRFRAAEVVNTILNAARTADNACKKRGWQNADLQALRANLREFEQFIMP